MEEGKESVFTLSDLANSYVDKDIMSMHDWVDSMNENEFNSHHRICNSQPEDRTEEDNYEISKYALILYCRELEEKTIAVTEELLLNLNARFCVNIITEALVKRGLAITEGPLFLYKETKIHLTEKGIKTFEG